MTQKVIFFLLVLTSTIAKGQMNFQDSSVQVISYWNLGDQYEYAVSFQKLKYTNQDTSLNETMTYDVDVSVIDSTKNSYTVRWAYKNFKTDAENPFVQKLVTASEDIAVAIKLDELGVIQSVENWEEVRDYMANAIDTLATEFPQIPEVEKMLEQVKAMYSSKAAIEAAAIKDVHQFHSFHGGKFFLSKKVIGQLKTPNIYYPDQPFDTEVSVMLEDLDQAGSQYRIRSFNEVNSEQLTATTFKYLSELFKDSEQAMPKREDFNNLTNVIETVARIHNTGWLLESISWKEVVMDGATNMEIRTILLK